MKSFLLFLLFITSIVLHAQTTYYVSNAGNDANSGTSKAAPWKSTYHVSNNTFNPGDRILFRRGDVWYGKTLTINSSGTSSKPIIFNTYVDGPHQLHLDKPIITTVSKFEQSTIEADWERVYGNQNIWRTKVTIENPGRLFKNYNPRDNSNQVELVMAYNIENLDKKTYSAIDGSERPKDMWFWLNKDSIFNETTVYNKKILYVVSSQNPASNNNLYKSTNIFDENSTIVFGGNASNIEVINIDFQGGVNCMRFNGGANNITVQHSKIGANSSNGVRVFKGRNLTFKNNIFNSWYESLTGLTQEDKDGIMSNRNYDLSGTDTRGNGDAIFITDGSNNEFYENTFKNWGHGAFTAVLSNDENGIIMNNKFHDNYISAEDISYARAFGLSGRRVNTVSRIEFNEIYNNLVKNTSIQSQIGGYRNKVHHNIIDGMTQSDLRPTGYAGGIALANSKPRYVTEQNVFDNNLFMNCADFGIAVNNWGQTPTDRNPVELNQIRNNIFYNCGNQIDGFQDYIAIEVRDGDHGQGTIQKNHFKHNLVYTPNAFVPIGGYKSISYYGTDFNVQEFNDGLLNNNDVAFNNISTNPLFYDLTVGYHLLEGSPCVDAGIKQQFLYDTDYYGTPYPYNGTADIGHEEVIHTNRFLNNPDKLYTQETINVFPNPTDNILNISYTKDLNITHYDIYSIDGKQLKTSTYTSNKIDVSFLRSGLYFLLLRDGNEIYTYKIQKK